MKHQGLRKFPTCSALALLSICILSLSAKAQTSTLNIDELNQKSQEQFQSALEAKEEAEEIKEVAKQEAYDVKHQLNHQKKQTALVNFKDSFQVAKIPKTMIAAPRALQGVEIQQANLIACVEKILVRNSGGYLKFQIAQELLLGAMDDNGWTNDSVGAGKSNEACNQAFLRLQQYKTRDLEKARLQKTFQELLVSNAAQHKSKILLGKLLSKEFIRCEVTQLKVQAGMGLGGGVNFNSVKCLMVNGAVRKYAGPGAFLGVGLGASLSLSKRDENPAFSNSSPNPIKTGSVVTSLDETDVVTLAAGIGVLNLAKTRTKSREWEVIEPQDTIGVSVLMAGITLDEALRLPNSTRHWDMLIDLLK